jgi:hypothetical protein
MGNLQGQPRITPFLWFNSNAEEAANFYVSVFDNSRILNIVRGPIDIVAPKGTVMVVSFELDGQTFTALNGGPAFHFTEAISFVVHCENQQSRSTASGPPSPLTEAQRFSAAGSRTSSASPGRSFPPPFRTTQAIPNPCRP